MIVLDTSVIYALLDGRDQLHGQALGWYRGVTDELVTTPLVLAEVDHLAANRAGARARAAFHHDVAAGAYRVEWWTRAAAETIAVAAEYPDLGIGLTDASLVSLAARLSTVQVATFDARHFRALRPSQGGSAFTLLPADA